jgi:hypothetical protein
MQNADGIQGDFTSDQCTMLYPKVSELAARSENCKWYSSLLLVAVVLQFYEPV